MTASPRGSSPCGTGAPLSRPAGLAAGTWSLGTPGGVLQLLLCRDPRRELGRSHDLDPEEHPAMVEPAQLRAPADGVRAAVQGGRRIHVEVVRMIGYHVTLEVERQDPERVHDVVGREVEPHRPVRWDLE